MNRGVLFGIGAVIVVTALLVLNLRSLVSDMSNKSPKIITASIKLVNKCSMSDDAFVLKDVKTGKSTTFINGIARIDILEGSSLQLALSKKYPDVIYNGSKVTAAPQTSITADCAQSERMGNTMKSFDNKELGSVGNSFSLRSFLPLKITIQYILFLDFSLFVMNVLPSCLELLTTL